MASVNWAGFCALRRLVNGTPLVFFSTVSKLFEGTVSQAQQL